MQINAENDTKSCHIKPIFSAFFLRKYIIEGTEATSNAICSLPLLVNELVFSLFWVIHVNNYLSSKRSSQKSTLFNIIVLLSPVFYRLFQYSVNQETQDDHSISGK